MIAAIAPVLWIAVFGLVALCVTIFAAVKRRKTAALLAGLTLIALFLTVLSGVYQRMGPDKGVYGDSCGDNYNELCEGLVLTAGFPFAYVVDKACCSVRYQLGLFEDDFRIGTFLLNLGIYSLLLWTGYVVGNRLRKHPRQQSML